jgi:outer membrane receptor protein involved in Fe transport
LIADRGGAGSLALLACYQEDESDMRLLRTFAALSAVLLLALPVAAQEQRGSIEGVVKDSSGAVLPGVAVEARTNTGVVLAATSDASGTYRFPSVAPGTYELSATLQGFSPKKQGNVDVGLGQTKKVDFALALQGVSESVQVTAESPLVDVRQSARQTNIRAEQVELLPHGRDFTSLVTLAPGANQENKLGGLSIDGASAGENRYIVDGIETTNLQSGISGKNVIADFVEEVQVKSSGYTAEFGGATGGVINVITKSGTNNWHGNMLFNWQGDKLSGGSVVAAGQVAGTGTSTGVPTLRLKLTDSNQAEYVTYPKDKENRIEPGFALGGPIAKNRLWFFGAYQPALTTVQRDVNPTTAVNPNAGNFSIERKQQVQYATGNVTSQLSDSLRARVAYNNSWSRTQGLLPSFSGTDRTDTNYGKTSTFPNYSVSSNVDWVASQKLFFGVRGGYYMSDQHDSKVTEEPQYIFQGTNNSCTGGVPNSATCPFPELIPANLQHGTGFSSIPSNQKVERDQQTRAFFQADSTLYAKLGGDHQFKVGVQADRVGNDVFSGNARPVVRIFWNTALSTGVPIQRGPYGYYEVRSNGVDHTKGIITEGNIHTTNIGLFVQDTWTLNNRLTINAGIRTERERVPTYTVGEDIPEFGLEFDFKDKFAPRVGFAYDIKGDGKWKAFGSWGVFYDIFKLELPRGSFGGDKWLSYYYSLDQQDYSTLLANSACPPSCPGTIIRGAPTAANPIGGIDFRHPSFGSDAIDPDLKPMRQQEATFGLDHQLNDVMALNVRYVHKQVDRAIEDTGSLDADGNEIYVIANPGEGLTALAFTNPNVALPKAKRDYDSVEFAFEKRFGHGWYLRSSYLWSRLFGNYSGLSQSDENGRTSPNVGRLFDYPLMMFQDGGKAAYGPLATDRPSQFKTQFIYQFPFGTSLGVNQYVASGLPVSRELGIYPPNTLPVNYMGRGTDGRTPTYSQTDLYAQHNFRLGARSFQISLNVLNLFNQETSVGRYSTYQQSGTGVVPNEALFYSGGQSLAQLITSQNVPQDPRFLKDQFFQAPIQARIGLKFLF